MQYLSTCIGVLLVVGLVDRYWGGAHERHLWVRRYRHRYQCDADTALQAYNDRRWLAERDLQYPHPCDDPHYAAFSVQEIHRLLVARSHSDKVL